MHFNKEELKSLCGRFWKFIKSSALFFFIFSMWIGGAAGAAILFDKLFEVLSISKDIRSIIFRILMTIIPFFPTLYFWNGRDKAGKEDIEGTTMDCCFMAWIAIVIVVWAFI